MAPLLAVILLSSVFVSIPSLNVALAQHTMPTPTTPDHGQGQPSPPQPEPPPEQPDFGDGGEPAVDIPSPQDAPATTEGITTGGGEGEPAVDMPSPQDAPATTVEGITTGGGDGGEPVDDGVGGDGQDDSLLDPDPIPVPPATADSIADSSGTGGGEGEPVDDGGVTGGGPVDGEGDDFDAIQAKTKAGAVTSGAVTADKGFDGDLFAGSAAPPVPDQKPEPTTITNDDGSKSKIEVLKTGDIRRTVTKYLPDDDTKIRSIDGYNKDDRIVYTISNNPSTDKRMSVTYYNPDNGQKIGYTNYNYDGKITRHTTYHPDLNEDGSHKRKSVTTYHANQKEPIKTFNGRQIIYTVDTFDPQNGAPTSKTDFDKDGIKIKRAEYDPITDRTKNAVVYKNDGETVDDTIDYHDTEGSTPPTK